MRLINFLLFALLTCPSYAEESPLKQYINNLSTLEANFSQKILNDYGEVIEQSSGIVYLKNPHKINWTYQQPYIQKIISDGKTLWVYEDDLEQVTLYDAENIFEKTPISVLLEAKIDEQLFTHKYLGEINNLVWEELLPKSLNDGHYQLIRLGFDGKQLSSIIIIDNFKQTMRIDFSQLKNGQAITDDHFQFTIPNDIDVIDNRQQ